MKAILASQFSIVQYQDRYYTKSAFASILRRYAAAFGPLVLCVPLKHEDAHIPIMEDVSETIAQIISVSRNESVLNQKKQEMAMAIQHCDLTIVRCHSFVAFRASDLAHRLKKPVLAEAMSCPWDAMWNRSLLGKLIAPYMFMKMRAVMYNADYAIYVTSKFLQQRYPCKKASIGVSNVELPPVSQAVLTQRLDRITAYEHSPIILMTCAAVNVAHKGHRYVIEALALMNSMGIHSTYYCVGQGDPSTLKKIAEKYGVSDQVVFTGVLPHDEVFSVLDNCDIYIQPSLQEGLPRALIEAMSRGCPCIGAKTAGIPELLPDECIVPKKSAKAIAEVVFSMLHDDLSRFAKENYKTSQAFQKDVLDTRRNAYFDKVRREVLALRKENSHE